MQANPPTRLRLAVSQSHTLSSNAATLSALAQTAKRAQSQSIDLVLFPEAYLGGYPRGATFGTAVGSRDEWGREQYLRHYKEAVDLGDTPRGEGERWAKRELDSDRDRDGDGTSKILRGDGTRERLEEVAKETGIFLVVGLVERSGGTLYCAVVYVCPRLGVIGKRRKVMPTGAERLIWGQGQPSSLRAVTTTIRGVKLTLAAAICWENYMPLLRQALYSQNVNLYLAPTADARDTWLPLMRTVACEGRCFVLSANQCIKNSNLPEWIRGKKGNDDDIKEEEEAPKRLRRNSLVTQVGHEIALPAGMKQATSGEGVIEDEEKTDGILRRRLSSYRTETGHEIIIPEKPKINGSQGKDPFRTAIRESSVMTGNDHEIALPSSATKEKSVATINGEPVTKTNSGSNLDSRGKSFKNEYGHEIVLPPEGKKCKFGKLPTGDINGSTFSLTSVSTTNTTSTPQNKKYASPGGSSIISPNGTVLAGPLWDQESGLLIIDADFDDCIRGRMDLDVAGGLGRLDAFELRVEGLELSPPLS